MFRIANLFNCLALSLVSVLLTHADAQELNYFDNLSFAHPAPAHDDGTHVAGPTPLDEAINDGLHQADTHLPLAHSLRTRQLRPCGHRPRNRPINQTVIPDRSLIG